MARNGIANKDGCNEVRFLSVFLWFAYIRLAGSMSVSHNPLAFKAGVESEKCDAFEFPSDEYQKQILLSTETQDREVLFSKPETSLLFEVAAC